MDDDFNFNDLRVSSGLYSNLNYFLIFYLKLSNSSNKKGMMDQTVSRKPNKTFNIIKNEMEEKTKKKNKIQSQVCT